MIREKIKPATKAKMEPAKKTKSSDKVDKVPKAPKARQVAKGSKAVKVNAKAARKTSRSVQIGNAKVEALVCGSNRH